MFTVSPSAVGAVKIQVQLLLKVQDNTVAVILITSPSGPSILPDLPGGRWVLEQKGIQVSSATSRQRDGDGAVCPTAASGVHAGLGELLAVLFGLLVCDVGQEAQCDRVPLLGQQEEQEAQADDAGGCKTHHAEDHLMFQNVYGCSMRRRRWRGEEGKLILIN